MRMDLVEALNTEKIYLARYHFGQHYSTCPKCSHTRKKKLDKCLSVLIDAKGAAYNCHHCRWEGGVKADIGNYAESTNFEQKDDERKMFAARAIWTDAIPIQDTLAEAYLRKRGIAIPLPPTLRFCESLKHNPSGYHFPALIAAVQSPQGKIIAVQRIYLKGPKKAAVSPAKMTLGSIGGGAVRLGPARECIGIAEGIETALSAMQIFGIPCWVALGKRFDAVEFPESVTTIMAFADNGGPGIEAVQKLRQRWKKKKRIGWKFPSEPYGDWNDELQEAGIYAGRKIG
jgi:hypothetical protein